VGTSELAMLFSIGGGLSSALVGGLGGALASWALNRLYVRKTESRERASIFILVKVELEGIGERLSEAMEVEEIGRRYSLDVVTQRSGFRDLPAETTVEFVRVARALDTMEFVGRKCLVGGGGGSDERTITERRSDREKWESLRREQLTAIPELIENWAKKECRHLGRKRMKGVLEEVEVWRGRWGGINKEDG